MYKKLDENRIFKTFLSGLAVFMLIFLVSSFPYEEVEAQNALGSFMGGRIIYFSPGYPWVIGVPPFATYGVCPPHHVVLSYGAPYRGVIGLTVPPLIPKSYYNYFTPGVAVKGAYYPVPLVFPSPFSCPFEPIPLFQTSLEGTAASPG